MVTKDRTMVGFASRAVCFAAVVMVTASCNAAFEELLKSKAASRATTPTEGFEKYAIPPPAADLCYPMKPSEPYLTQAPDVGTTSAAPVLFVAPFGIPGTEGTTESRSFRHLLRFQLTAGSFAEVKWLNLQPDVWIDSPYGREDNKDEMLVRPRERYVKDAQLLQSDYYIDGHFEQTSESVKYNLYCCELTSGRAQTFEAASRKGWTPALIADAVKNVAKFCGLSDEDIRASALLEGLPKESWEFLRSDTATDPAEFEAAAKLDPNCRFLYRCAAERAKRKAIEFTNEGVKKFPNEPRMFFAKSWATASNGDANASLLLQTPLIKRWPQSMVYSGSYVNSLKSCYSSSGKSRAAPDEFIAGIKLREAMLRIWPKNWALHWDLANARYDLAYHVRGSYTIDKVHFLSRIYFGEMMELAVADILKAVEIRSDCPDLLKNALSTLFQAGETDLDQQKKLLNMILAIDPSNTEAEGTIAYSHSAGWDDPRIGLAFIIERLDAREDVPRAYASLFDDFSVAIKRMFGFDYADPKEFCTKQNPIIRTYLRTAENVMNGPADMSPVSGEVLLQVYEAVGDSQKAVAVADSQKSPSFTYAYASKLKKEKDYAKALQYSKAIQSKLTPRWQVRNRKLSFDCLLLLKKPEEALKLAQQALKETPNSADAHHLMARAYENIPGKHQLGLQHAEKAVQYDPEDDDFHETLSRLKANGRKRAATR